MRRELLYVSVILSILMCLSPISAAAFTPEVIDFNCPCCGEQQNYTTHENVMTSQLNCSECHRPIIAYRKHFVVSKKWTFEANYGNGVPIDRPYFETKLSTSLFRDNWYTCPSCGFILVTSGKGWTGDINLYLKCCVCGGVFQNWHYWTWGKTQQTIIIPGNITHSTL